MNNNIQRIVVGVDEAGRGPLAGPVVAAAVILDPTQPIAGLADSKKLTEKKRDSIFELINKYALEVAIGTADVSEIDDINILQASLLAMQRAVASLKYNPTLALIDGNKCPQLSCEARAIVKGDQLEPAISAASIIAKVTRDREMLSYHQQYPEYGFDKHKGYPTKLHIAMLRKVGVSPIHRRSFGPVRNCL